MRVATFNILHGRSLTDDQVSVEALARAVRSLDADVLAVATELRLPTGSKERLLGTGDFTIAPRVIASLETARRRAELYPAAQASSQTNSTPAGAAANTLSCDAK